MDDTLFDTLTRRVAAITTRRAALRLGGAALGGLMMSASGVAGAPLEAQRCMLIGERCGRRRQRRCAACCTGYGAGRRRRSQRRCTCRPDFKRCQRPDQCCSGRCEVFDCGCEPDGERRCVPGLFGDPSATP